MKLKLKIKIKKYEFNHPKIVLIVGCAHSGTSWLCSMLGAHSLINMSYESMDWSVTRYSGKPINANKLTTNQIHYSKRSNVFGKLINRISYPYRYWPLSYMSVKDYLMYDATLIFLLRDYDDLKSSLIKRNNFSEDIANKYIIQSDELFNLIKAGCFSGYLDPLIYWYEELKDHTERVLESICKKIGIEYEEQMLEYGKKYIHRYQDR